MKKLLLLLLIILTAGKVCAASPINVDYNDGIYHIVISGEKIKKQIHFHIYLEISFLRFKNSLIDNLLQICQSGYMCCQTHAKLLKTSKSGSLASSGNQCIFICRLFRTFVI